MFIVKNINKKCIIQIKPFLLIVSMQSSGVPSKTHVAEKFTIGFLFLPGYHRSMEYLVTNNVM